MKLKILDLFSGLGGFSLGLERTGNFETVAFCDNDKYSKLVLQKHWKGVKIYNDVKEITKEKFIADGIQFPDIITGGFPCQPFSVAGKQAGTDDDRHLWPVMFRIIQEFTPRWVIGENVKGLTNIQDGVVFETVCSDLEGAGYEVRAFNIPAASVGAPHRRERIWIIASLVNANSDGSFTTTIGGSDEKTSNEYQEEGRIDSSARLTEQNKFNTANLQRTMRDMEDSRRTLQSRTELREKNEDEVGEGYANQHQRSGSTSESNVADTYARLSNGTYEEVQSRGQTSDTSSEGSTDVANTESSIGYDNEAVTRDGGSSTQEVFGNGSSVSGEGSWWQNPTWVEWLMGYPAEYTDLKDWEILSSRKSRKKSAKPSQKKNEDKTIHTGAANEYVRQHHRHSKVVVGCKFCIAAVDEDGQVIGVAIVGRPVARKLDDGYVGEIVRTCTEGAKNVNSFLYGACARIWKEMGGTKILTYTLETESGISLKAAGYKHQETTKLLQKEKDGQQGRAENGNRKYTQYRSTDGKKIFKNFITWCRSTELNASIKNKTRRDTDG